MWQCPRPARIPHGGVSKLSSAKSPPAFDPGSRQTSPYLPEKDIELQLQSGVVVRGDVPAGFARTEHRERERALDSRPRKTDTTSGLFCAFPPIFRPKICH